MINSFSQQLFKTKLLHEQCLNALHVDFHIKCGSHYLHYSTISKVIWIKATGYQDHKANMKAKSFK